MVPEVRLVVGKISPTLVWAVGVEQQAVAQRPRIGGVEEEKRPLEVVEAHMALLQAQQAGLGVASQCRHRVLDIPEPGDGAGGHGYVLREHPQEPVALGVLGGEILQRQAHRLEYVGVGVLQEHLLQEHLRSDSSLAVTIPTPSLAESIRACCASVSPP